MIEDLQKWRRRWNVLSVRMKCYVIPDHSAAAGIGSSPSHMKKILRSNNRHNHGYYTGSSAKSNHLIPFSSVLIKRRKQRWGRWGSRIWLRGRQNLLVWEWSQPAVPLKCFIFKAGAQSPAPSPHALGFSSSPFTYHLERPSCRSRERRPQQPSTHLHAKALIRAVSPKTEAQGSHRKWSRINVQKIAA